MADQLSVESIVATLQRIPIDLYQSDIGISTLEAQVSEAKENLELAETNASLNAPQDGKNADARDLQRRKAILSDNEVKQCKHELSIIEGNLEREKADNKQLARSFAAYCHIAELKVAQMNLMSKGVTK